MSLYIQNETGTQPLQGHSGADPRQDTEPCQAAVKTISHSAAAQPSSSPTCSELNSDASSRGQLPSSTTAQENLLHPLYAPLDRIFSLSVDRKTGLCRRENNLALLTHTERSPPPGIHVDLYVHLFRSAPTLESQCRLACGDLPCSALLL